jgi:hypothetical protein
MAAQEIPVADSWLTATTPSSPLATAMLTSWFAVPPTEQPASMGEELALGMSAELDGDGTALVAGAGELPDEAQALRMGARTVSKMRGRARRTHG